MKTLPLLLLILAAGSLGCDENPISPTQLRNVTWKLESIERAGSPAISVPNPDQYTLRLEDDGRLIVRSDCNSCSGRYSQSGTSLSINNVACTLVFCSLASLDGNYASALEHVQSAVVNGSSLVVAGSGFTLRFRS